MSVILAHSLSPILFEYLSYKYHISIHYSRLAIDNLDDFNKIFNENLDVFDGFNITYPLKKDVYHMCQHYSNIPTGIHCCNTIVCKPSISIYNTDYHAIKYILSREVKNLWEQVIILGSGMTASICAWALINYYKPIIIFYHKNINYEYFPKNKNVHWKQLNKINESINDKTLLINTLSPMANYEFLPKKLNAVTTIIDTDYRNLPLKNVAISNNINYIDGYHWLYYQGIEAFKIFTNKTNLSVEYNEEWIKINKYDKIALIGMSGAGKTTIGQKLAKKLNYQFVDIDEIIEKQEHKTISEIFADDGEDFFRQLETQMLAKIIKNEKIIIATGGGIIESEKNRKLLKSNFFNILLYVNVDEAINRLNNSKTRPLLTGNIKGNWEKLWNDRRLLYYETADYIINLAKNNEDLIYEDIKEIIKK